MSRQPDVYLNDMLGAIEKIQRYTSKMSYESFTKDELVPDEISKLILTFHTFLHIQQASSHIFFLHLSQAH